MGAMSKRKGKKGERELSKELSRLLGLECRRGVQFQGGPDSPDVVGVPGVHIEAKRTEKLQLWAALDQAVGESGGNIPVVCHRPNRREWIAVVRLDDLPALAVKLFHLLAERK